MRRFGRIIHFDFLSVVFSLFLFLNGKKKYKFRVVYTFNLNAQTRGKDIEEFKQFNFSPKQNNNNHFISFLEIITWFQSTKEQILAKFFQNSISNKIYTKYKIFKFEIFFF